MSSRSSAGAIVFVVAVVGIGLFAAYRSEQKTPDTAPAAPETAGANSEAVASAPPPEGSSTGETRPAAPQAPAEATPEPAQQAAAEVSQPSGEPEAESASTDTAAATNAASDGKSEPAPASGLQAPTYDLVRVEPTGDAVIAGRASPGATVELLVNGKVVASTVANATGEWVLVLDQPLAPGDYDIALQASDANTKAAAVSEDRLAVSIPANGSETPMVALSRPNAPVEVLQKPAATITAEATQVAAADAPAAEAATATATAGKSDRSASAPTVEGTPVPPAASPAGEAGGGETVIGHQTASEDARVSSADAASTTAAPTAGAPVVTAEGASSGAAVAKPTSKPAAPAAGGKDEGTAAEETVPVSIEIAEAEGDTFRLQGMSKPGADVWIYLAGEYVGEARASETGHWSFEEKMAFEEGDYSIRVDQVANRAGAVATRAEVPFAFKRAGKAAADVAGGKDGGPKVAVLGETEEGVRVLIRKGDNLWTIAHHFYGNGFSYANIYRENNGQIRNPHLIYPGQVFVMPGLTKKDVTGIAKDRAL